MNDKNWYDEVKEDFAKNINDSYTLNLALSVLEDRKELLNENLKLQQELQQKEDIINKARKYISKHTQHDENGYVVECLYVEEAKELLEILDNEG